MRVQCKYPKAEVIFFLLLCGCLDAVHAHLIPLGKHPLEVEVVVTGGVKYLLVEVSQRQRISQKLLNAPVELFEGMFRLLQ